MKKEHPWPRSSFSLDCLQQVFHICDRVLGPLKSRYLKTSAWRRLWEAKLTTQGSEWLHQAFDFVGTFFCIVLVAPRGLHSWREAVPIAAETRRYQKSPHNAMQNNAYDYGYGARQGTGGLGSFWGVPIIWTFAFCALRWGPPFGETT